MAIRLTTTEDETNFITMMTIAPSGHGKTKLIKTAPKPIIIAAENGLLSLKGSKLPVIKIDNHIDFEAAYELIIGPKCKAFETVCIDSISDIAEACLAWFKENPVDGNTHPQAAYGHMADAILPTLKKFLALSVTHSKNVYVTAKVKRMEDQYTGIDTFMPSAPGRVIGPALPYLFDFVLPLRIAENEAGKKYRYLQCQPDLQYVAKDRSGNLADIERPHLGHIFAKALGKPLPGKAKAKAPAKTVSTGKKAATAEEQAAAQAELLKRKEEEAAAKLAAEAVAKEKADQAAEKKAKADAAEAEAAAAAKEEADALAAQEQEELGTELDGALAETEEEGEEQTLEEQETEDQGEEATDEYPGDGFPED